MLAYECEKSYTHSESSSKEKAYCCKINGIEGKECG